MNSAVSIHTQYLEEFLRGTADLQIVKDPKLSKMEMSLEAELMSKGYSSMQNKLKHFLIKQQVRSGSKEDITLPEISKEEAHRIIYTEKKLCTARAGAAEGSPVSNALERYISYNFEETTRKTVFFYPKEEKKTGDLLPDAKCRVSMELYGDNSDTHLRNVRDLLTQKARKQSGPRKDLIQAAYRLGMDLHETNEFLTKAAFTYALDYLDPWERKAAYLIACHPVQDGDSPMVFQSKMQTAEPTDSFLNMVCRSEFLRWVDQYRHLQNREEKEAFLLEWAWKLLVGEDPKYGKKSFYTKQTVAQRKQVNDAFAAQFARLQAIAEQIDGSTNLPATDFPIATCMMDRQRHLLDLIYASIWNPDDCLDVELCAKSRPFTVTYYPPFKEYGFTKLERDLRKIAEPDRHISRSDIITLGIVLGFRWEQFDRALEAAGFYKLYVKDIQEQALIAALVDEPEDLEQAFWAQLQQRYGKLSAKLRKNVICEEPEWVRGIRNAVSTSNTDH